MRNLLLLFTIIFFFNAESISGQIYISVDGNDNNSGTIDAPLKSITTAISKAIAGDTIFVRGGIYTLTTTISISKSGTASAQYYLFAYKNERPLLNFSLMAVNSSNRGIKLSGKYWYIKGIDIKGAGDNGMNVTGSNNIIEFCSFYENKDTGLQLGNGASNNKIINCDSYYNADLAHGNADGFAAKLDVGSDNYFYGCRAWQNSDDGWDGYLRGADNINTIVENSWCFHNGYLKDGTVSSGNGNGYKMGGGDNGNSLNLANNFTLINSIAFDNRVKGFDQNNNRGSMILYNCSAYRNGNNYSIPSVLNSGKTANISNCIALGSVGSIAAFVIQQTNIWHSQFSVSVDDFKTIDTSGVRSSRKPDGSLPDVDFLHLSLNSDLLNSGTNLGLPFSGSAPDLGYYEFDETGLPVELISFSAEPAGERIMLKWKTMTELNNYGFEVQRRTEANLLFTSVGFVEGAGSSVNEKEYTFSDQIPGTGFFEYRLKQIDYSGSYTYSQIIETKNTSINGFSLSQNYPNPFNAGTVIRFSLAESTPVKLVIYDILGEVVSVLLNNETLTSGNYNIQFDASQLSGGTYIFSLTQGNSRVSRKMILLK